MGKTLILIKGMRCFNYIYRSDEKHRFKEMHHAPRNILFPAGDRIYLYAH